jgi:hypothetical protein
MDFTGQFLLDDNILHSILWVLSFYVSDPKHSSPILDIVFVSYSVRFFIINSRKKLNTRL